jgi:hypothetical protein
MSFPRAARRSVAVAATTALLTVGGIAGGLLVSPASAVGEPAVSSATPNADNNSGSSAVTINGSGFVPASDSVSFTPNPDSGPKGDGVAAIRATVDTVDSTPTALKVTVPLTLAAPGAYDIVVSRTGVSPVACSTCFTVTSNGVPDVSSVVPGASTGTTSRGSRALDLNGAFFAKGAKVDFLRSDNTPDPGLAFTAKDPNNTSNGFPSSAQLRGNYSFPASTTFTPGRHQLRVTNTDGRSGATVEFWQPVFQASGVSPATRGAGSQNQTITVTGEGIRQGSSLAIQNLAASGQPSDVSVEAATVNAAGTAISAPVSFRSDAKPTTGRSVTINGPDGGTWSVADAFRLTGPPSIDSLNIDTLGQGATQDVQIVGSDFATGGTAGLPTFTFSGVGVTGVTKSVATSTVLDPSNPPDGTLPVTTATVALKVARDATLGGRSVTVTNPDGGSSTLGQDSATMAYPFTVAVGPVVTVVNPASAPRTVTKTVVVQGTDFDATDGVNVGFSVPPATGATRTNDATLSVGTVTVTNGANGGPDTASFPVTVTSTAPFGLRDITLTNKGDFGSYLCAGCFGVDSLSVPTASGNNAGSNSGPKSVNFNGSGIPSGSTVQLVRAGDPAYQPHLVGGNASVAADGNSMTATFDLTNAAPGPYNAVVTQGSTVLSCASCFTVTGSTPTLTSLAPNAGGQGAVDRAVTLTGSKFSRGQVITIAGLTVHDVTFVSPTQLTAQVDIPTAASTGAKDVKITNADGVGTSTLTGGYTVTAAPTVSDSSPAAYGQGARQQQVTVTGPGFVTGASGQPSSTLDLGPGITITKVVVTQGTATPVVDPAPDDTLVATIDVAESAAATVRDVKVSNPDGGAGTLAKGFTVNAGPKVSGITPAALTPGASGKTLTINGTGFSTTSGNTAVPSIAGLTLTNPVVAADGGSLTVTASVDSGTAKGAKDVVVTNPTDQGAGTCAGCFAVATAPGAPTGVVARSGQGSIVVSWSAPADNGSPITSYVVTAKGPDGKAAGAPVTTGGKTTTATLTGLTSGTTYTVSVIARNAAGDSAPGTATGTPSGVPSPPTVVKVRPGDRQVTVTFSGARPNGSTITGYTVHISSGSEKPLTASERAATFTGLTNGVSYTFTVKAKNATGYGASSAGVSATPKNATRLTSAQAPATTTAGQAATVRGKLVRARDGAALAGAVVTLTVTPDVGGGAKTVRLTTDINGAWAYRTTQTYNHVIRTTYNGDGDDAAAAVRAYRRNVATKVVVTTPKNGSSSSAGKALVIKGTTSPNKAGQIVGLYRFSGGKYVGFAQARVASNGSYTFSVKLGKGRYTLKVGIGATRGNSTGYSPGFGVHRK